MTGHFILMATILIAPHLKERTGQISSVLCLVLAVLVMMADFGLIVARASGWLK